MYDSRRFVNGRHWAAFWLVVLVVSAIYVGDRVLRGDAFESNILGLMPDDDNVSGDLGSHPDVAEQFQKRFVLLLRHPDADRGAALADVLKKQLAQQSSLVLHDASQTVFAELKAYFKPYRHQLLAPQTRRALQVGDVDSLAQTVVKELYNPVGAFRLYSFAEDPFNLGGAWLQTVFPEFSRFQGAGEALRVDDQIWQLISGEVEGSPFDLSTQQALMAVVDNFRARHGDAELLLSGLVFHAAEASRIARFEISTVGSGSLLGILLLVVLVFRSGRALGAIAFTLGSGVLLALATTLLVFDRVHLVTLAFGSTLLGLAVDYCFHFLVKYRLHGNALVAGRLIRKGLLISAGSSIAAYLLQLFSPFPGLQQFAVFVVAGLVGACCAVAIMALSFRDSSSPGFDQWQSFFDVGVEPVYARLFARRGPACLLLLVLVPVLGGYVFWQGGSDDIRLLNTSSQSLLESERRVQSLLGSIDPQRYWIVTGEDTQQLLERTEHLLATLTDKTRGVTPLAVTTLTPSLSRQRQDHALAVDSVYGPDGAVQSLCDKLGSDCAQWQLLPGAFQDGLVPEKIPAAVAGQFPPLALTGRQHTIVLQRQGETIPASTLRALNQLPGITYVDRVQGISASLGAFRVDVSILLGVFLGVFMLACLFLYGKRGLAILASVLVSMLASLALSASGGVTLFHMLALLLVMGLTVDTAVFYLELGFNAGTWLASTLASATSILAFGLLSLSQVPLLHHFGSVVFFGLLCAWLTTPLLLQFAGGFSDRHLMTGPKS